MCEHGKVCYLWLDGKLTVIDRCMGFFVLQLSLSGIKTLDSCCGHGKGYPHIICASGMEDKLREFGCEIVITRQGNLVSAYFPVYGWTGKTLPEDS